MAFIHAATLRVRKRQRNPIFDLESLSAQKKGVHDSRDRRGQQQSVRGKANGG
jgi:hypothetical protein